MYIKHLLFTDFRLESEDFISSARARIGSEVTVTKTRLITSSLRVMTGGTAMDLADDTSAF